MSLPLRQRTYRRHAVSILLLLQLLLIRFGLYGYLRRNVSNHKLLDEGTVRIVAILLTVVPLAVLLLCGVRVTRWVRERSQNDNDGGRGNTSMATMAIVNGRKCLSLACKRKRLVIAAIALSLSPTVTILSRWLTGCGSMRTLEDLNGNTVRICARGGGHTPSLFAVSEPLVRFLGDTFLFRDEGTLPHLDWRAAVLETDKCRRLLKTKPEKNATRTQGCSTDAAEAIGPSPAEKDRPWQRQPRRDDNLLAPFRVSNELRETNALRQAKLVTRQLGECHLDATSRIVLESSSASETSSRDPLVLQANPKHGHGTAIVLSGFNNVERNIYHVTQMDSSLYCLFIALQNAASSDAINRQLSVVLPMSWESPMGNALARALAQSFDAEVLVLQQNYTFIQQQSYQKLINVHGPYQGGISGSFRSGSLGFEWPLWDSFKFEWGRSPSSFGMAYADAVARGNRMLLSKVQPKPHSRSGDNGVLVIQRRNSRRLVGSQSGTFFEIIEAMCSLGLPVNVVELEALSAEEQIQVVSSSTVLVAAHGAGISHAAWMPSGAAVVEVLMRQGFPGTDYHKADFANEVRFFGKQYVYYDAVSLLPSDTPEIGAHSVVVDAEELAKVVFCLHEKFRVEQR